MVSIKMRRPENVARVGLYSNSAEVVACEDANNPRLLFIGGNVSVDSQAKAIGGGDFSVQLAETYRNLHEVLLDADMDWRNVVKFTTYLVSEDYIEEFYKVRAKLFKSFYPTNEFPPNTLLVVRRLVEPDYLVEIEAVAAG